jgi:hypothetical protein
LLIITSALVKSFLSHGSIWQLLDEVPVSEEDSAVSNETGFSAEPQIRHADAHVSEVENLLDGNGKSEDDQGIQEARESLRGTRRSLEERREQWVNRRTWGTRPLLAVEECVVRVRAGELTRVDARDILDVSIEDI